MEQNTADVFVRVVQQARLSKGLTQRQLADLMHWKSDSYLSMIESGRRGVSLEELPALAHALDLDARSLTKLHLQVYSPAVYRLLFGDRPAKVSQARGEPADDLSSKIDRLSAESRSVLEHLVNLLARPTHAR